MTTKSEGVELQEQLEIVRSLGCREEQGYLFSAPRPAEEVMRLFWRRKDGRDRARGLDQVLAARKRIASRRPDCRPREVRFAAARGKIRRRLCG
jgi:predicted signal transduction protein with EAL and GGDEF domain